MRLLHTSDWHLGRSFHGEGLLDAHQAYLDHLVEVTRSEAVDVVVVSGDIYDRALPAPSTVALLDDALNRLLDTGASVVMTSGNHDSAIRLGFGSRVMEHAGLFIRSAVESIDRPIDVRRRAGAEVVGQIIAIPYLEPTVAAPKVDAEEATHASVLRASVQRARARMNGQVPSVVMAHAFFQGATTSDSERDICVGGLGVVPTDVVSSFDYAALGHIHGAKTLSERVRYSGSPVAMSFSEASHTKGSWLVDVTTDSFKAEFITAPVTRRLAVLKGELGQLLDDPALAVHEDAWCQVTLTDAVRPAGAMDAVRRRFPHTLRLLFEHQETSDAAATYAQRLAGRSDVELCGDFLTHVRGGRGPNAGERTSLERAVAHALHTPAQSDEGALLSLEELQ